MTPTPRLLALLGVWMAIALGVALLGRGVWVWEVAGGLVLGVIAFDAALAWRAPPITAKRRGTGTMAVGVWHDLQLRLSNPRQTALRCQVFDHYPTAHAVRGLPQTIDLPPGGWGELHYQLRPDLRGEFAFGPVELAALSPLGLWARRFQVDTPDSMRVYPNFAALTKYALLATDQRLSQIGILKRRRRGEGLEFHQLREYRRGDALRSIDWKATSRTGKLISREYQDERDQQVVFLVDCGRRMRAQDEELSHFDHALNAVLLLSYVALRQGDSVGVLTFGGADRWYAPRKSSGSVNSLLSTLYDLQPTTHAADYLKAAEQFMLHVRKRSLVVLVTNLRDEDDDTLQPALALLRTRHLVLLASLRERSLDVTLEQDVTSFDDALQHAALHGYQRQRQRTFELLSHLGVQTLDVLPDRLAVSMVNKYLDIKRTGRL